MRAIAIRRPVTVLLLLAVTVSIIAVTVWTTGKSYSKVDPRPFDDLRLIADRFGTRPMSTQLLAVLIVPIIGNILLFLPWGFLTFIALYTVERPTMQTYLLTVLLGLSFTLTIEAWQYFTPTRVLDVNDVIWNTSGATLGAILGHMRLRLRFDFE
ncbi:MAG TPA: VanZ family protein [Thermoanaerobaculia bacterium]|nr:VanZ family protein [Thermoanaerobaculia bacterium]